MICRCITPRGDTLQHNGAMEGYVWPLSASHNQLACACYAVQIRARRTTTAAAMFNLDKLIRGWIAGSATCSDSGGLSAAHMTTASRVLA